MPIDQAGGCRDIPRGTATCRRPPPAVMGMRLSPGEFDYVRKLVFSDSAIAIELGKEYLAEARLGALAVQEGLGSMHDLIARLREDETSGLRRKVVEAMTTNETSFFRDVHPFETLRQRVIPGLMGRRATERRLNFWSAACSSGQEPYSLALMVREHFPELAGWSVRILASDLSGEMLHRARIGRYTQMEVNRGLPAHLLIRYFRRKGREWEIDEDIRDMVEFDSINLVGAWPALPPMDVILMRNTLIYFDVRHKRSVLRRLAGILRPDGYLVMGGAETPLFLDPSYERAESVPGSIYRLRGPG